MSKSSVPNMALRSRSVMRTPCKDCEDREIGCHGKCDKYRDYHSRILDDRRKMLNAYVPEKQAEADCCARGRKIGKR